MPLATTFTIPPPARIVGDPNQDVANLQDWAWDLYQNLVVINQVEVRLQSVVEKLDAIGSLTQLTATLSDPPTASQVVPIGNLVNQIIAAAAATTA